MDQLRLATAAQLGMSLGSLAELSGQHVTLGSVLILGLTIVITHVLLNRRQR